MNFSTVALMKEKDKLNIKAASQPPTWKPSRILSVKTTIAALITSENKPKVMQVIGNAKILMIGFMKVLSSVSTKATFTASKGEFTIGLLKPDHTAGNK